MSKHQETMEEFVVALATFYTKSAFELIRGAIADGFTNGNERYEDCSPEMQHRFDDAALAVLALTSAYREGK